MNYIFKHCFLFSLILLLATGCGHHGDSISSDAMVTKADTATFKALFKELHFDSLYVVSAGDSCENKNCFLHGISLDTIYQSLFPDTIRNYAITFSPGEDQQFAVGRFYLDEYHDGYLIRCHGENFTSRIILVVYDKKQAKFLREHIELATDWGDAGESGTVSSTLINNGEQLAIRQHIFGSEPEQRDSTFNTILQETRDEIYSLERGHIRKVTEVILKRDTINPDFYKNMSADTMQKEGIK